MLISSQLLQKHPFSGSCLLETCGGKKGGPCDCGIKEKALALLLDGPQFQSQLCIYLSHVLIIQILWGLSFPVCKMGIILPTGS